MKSEFQSEIDRLLAPPPECATRIKSDEVDQAAERNLEQLRIKLKILREYMDGKANPLLKPDEEE